MLWGSVIAISLLTTAYSLCLKKVQKQYIRSKADFFGFIFYLNLFQFIFQLALPPYDALHFSRESILYGTAFGVVILVYYLFMILALARGPLVLTNSILALYLVIPIIYGLFFWDETLSVLAVAGLVLFLISIILITNASYFEQQTEKKIQLKWLVLVLIAFLCSGATSILSKQIAIIQPGESKEYLLVCRLVNMIIAGLVFLAARLWMRRKAGKVCLRAESAKAADLFRPDRRFFLLSLAAGAIMALANMLFMNVVASFSSAVFFPLTQALSMLLMFVFSRLMFKEYLSRKALSGYILIVLAIMVISSSGK